MSDVLKNTERAFSHEFDEPEVISFEDYRELCDMVDEFRKVGVQDKESYEAMLHDERSVFIEYEGYKIPLLTPLEYEKMYDEERCLLMSGKDKAMLLAIPLSILERMQLEETYEVDEDTLVIVEEFVPTNTPVRPDQHDVSDLPFINVESLDFKNPELSRNPDNEMAWMAAYRFDMMPRDGSSRLYDGKPLTEDFMRSWRERCTERGDSMLPKENATGTFLLSAEQLANRPDLVEQLWDISQIGFGKILGAHHPISMEFNKQFFDKQIVANNTITGMHCIDGQVVCFGFIGLDMKNNEWLNDQSSVLQREIKGAEDNHKALVHFHELIGRGQRGMGYATRILNTLFDTAARTGYPYSVFFESTNLSSLYIPPLISRDLQRSETMSMTSNIDMLGKLSYWALVAEQT